MKILHLTYHHGCKKTLDFMAQSLGHEITTQFADWNYNIGHNRAEEVWNKHKDHFNSFDVIITSDTAPLSRIFLQNGYAGKLIIWICNRFDYADGASNDCGFPDREYYDLMRGARTKSNVKIFSYTKFEYEYARKYKGVELGSEMIKPCAFIEENVAESAIPSSVNKAETFFVPPYHNDTIFMNLQAKCTQLGIPSYAGRYNGPLDLQGIRGIIHIPYAWSNLALFENWSIGNVYLIPSKEMLINLSRQTNFWWQDSYAINMIEASEWYLPEHDDLFIKFSSWDHLKQLSNDSALLQSKREKALTFSKQHTEMALQKWNNALNQW
jgi:hypothetical protein